MSKLIKIVVVVVVIVAKILSRSVTAEIFLIWANVASTNVAWAYVNLIFEICSRCSQEATFKVLSKSGQ